MLTLPLLMTLLIAIGFNRTTRSPQPPEIDFLSESCNLSFFFIPLHKIFYGLKIDNDGLCLLPPWIVKSRETQVQISIKLAKFDAGIQITDVMFYLKEQIYKIIVQILRGGNSKIVNFLKKSTWKFAILYFAGKKKRTATLSFDILKHCFKPIFSRRTLLVFLVMRRTTINQQYFILQFFHLFQHLIIK